MTEQHNSKIDYQALSDFRYEVRRFLHFVEQAAQAAGIEPQQYQALLAIRGLPGGTRPTVGALSERMQIRHHSAAELAARLERCGWIARSRGDSDRREVLLRLTRRGEKLLETLSQLHRRELRTTAPRLIEALEYVVKHNGHLPRAPQSKKHAAPKRKVRRSARSRRTS